MLSHSKPLFIETTVSSCISTEQILYLIPLLLCSSFSMINSCSTFISRECDWNKYDMAKLTSVQVKYQQSDVDTQNQKYVVLKHPGQRSVCCETGFKLQTQSFNPHLVRKGRSRLCFTTCREVTTRLVLPEEKVFMLIVGRCLCFKAPT